jgi:hypothetical protein
VHSFRALKVIIRTLFCSQVKSIFSRKSIFKNDFNSKITLGFGAGGLYDDE